MPSRSTSPAMLLSADLCLSASLISSTGGRAGYERWLPKLQECSFTVPFTATEPVKRKLIIPVYPGIASTASFFLNETEPAFGSLLQIGFAYAFGIAFAIITSASTSGGHFNPVGQLSSTMPKHRS